MKRKSLLWGGMIACIFVLGAMSSWVGAAPPVQSGDNLLQNPGFEGITCRPDSPPGRCYDNWTRDTFNGIPYGEIFTPQGWVTFWSEGPNPFTGDNYGRPECKVIENAGAAVGPPARIRSGAYSVQQFGFYRSIDSGVYQVVGGLSPGAVVQASAYAHAWSCDDDPIEGAYSCGDQYNMLFQVGIDPTGATNPWGPTVVWASGYSYDEYRLIGPVQATVGDSGTVTVFLHALAKWSYKHNDAYWDDASLVYVTPPEPPTNTPLPPPPTITPGPSPTPMSTPTPRPDGAIVHIVQSGDTLYGIALQYGVPVEQIQQLNVGSIPANNWLTVGQELVIAIPEHAPTPPPATPVPTEEPSPPPAEGETTPPETAPVGNSGVCVVAYHDRNGDGFRQDATEEMLPRAVFSLSDANGILAQYTTDGLNEPYCFTGLAAGNYQLELQPPQGYSLSGPGEMYVALGEDGRMDVAMGAQRVGEAATGDESPPEEEQDSEARASSSVWSDILRWGARIGGVLVLAAAAAAAVLFVFSRGRL
ncbi:MAG: LysM peptidoglycan-binding domain-containing protein [Anaerolineae bacterium]|nr:LysM peptidoglycan-binding domain-containing protein [Anaerolineae bacterium]